MSSCLLLAPCLRALTHFYFLAGCVCADKADPSRSILSLFFNYSLRCHCATCCCSLLIFQFVCTFVIAPRECRSVPAICRQKPALQSLKTRPSSYLLQPFSDLHPPLPYLLTPGIRQDNAEVPAASGDVRCSCGGKAVQCDAHYRGRPAP